MRELLNARLTETEAVGLDTRTFLFTALGGTFVGCEPGAHVDVHLPGGLVRNYSLIDWDTEGTWVKIGVKLEESGRGGSAAMHSLEIGAVLPVAQPRNNFPLHAGDGPIVLVGGGIGITPLLAMARRLRCTDREFELFYLVRSREMAAFEKVIDGLDLGSRWALHCDDMDGVFVFEELLTERPPEARYYACGPEPMLRAVRDASKKLDKGQVFFERFAADPALPKSEGDTAFEVMLRSTGERLAVPAGRSILSVLRNAGHDVDYACSEGACGTCVMDVVEGEIDHRDSFLGAEERAAGDCMCVCVSRARSALLVLEL